MKNPLDVTQEYFNAWNAHDAGAIGSIFTEDGEYQDPNVKIQGRNINTYVRGLWEAFPDLSFEIVSKSESGEGIVATQWLMKGTHNGSFQGLPPTGKKVLLPGVDFLEISGDKIKSVIGYFDGKAVPEQLGLQVLVQPYELGPFSFGYSVFAKTGKMNKPGAFGIAGIWNSDEDTSEIRDRGRDIAKELLKMEGFIGLCLVRAGKRSITISAWDSPEDFHHLLKSQTHNNAKKRFWEELADAAFTSVWVAHHINPLWVRCKKCGKMNPFEKNKGICSCGGILPDPPPYF